MLEVLETLEHLLRKHGHFGQAGVIDRLLSTYQLDRSKFIEICQSIDVWGGSGAVWECGEFADDENEFRVAMIRLAEEMQAEGYGTERSNSIASVFRKWQAAGK